MQITRHARSNDFYVSLSTFSTLAQNDYSSLAFVDNLGLADSCGTSLKTSVDLNKLSGASNTYKGWKMRGWRFHAFFKQGKTQAIGHSRD